MIATPVLSVHPDLGRIFLPRALARGVSLPGRVTRRASLGEYGVVVAVQKRPVYDDAGRLRKLAMIWHSISHNERVDQGAVRQDVACFGAGTTSVFTAVAVANATLAGRAKSDLSLGSASANATTNEFTGSGLTRAAGSLGAYTAPASLGAVFSRVISKTFTASGSVTAWGSGLFDSTTVVGSNLYVEDNFGSTAVLVNADTLSVQWTISN